MSVPIEETDYRLTSLNENSNFLVNALKPVRKEDPYSISPAYYLTTGRKGVWSYGNKDEFLILMQHPNIENRALVFLHGNEGNQKLIAHLFASSFLNKKEVQFARLSSKEEEIIQYLETINFVEREEDILDWYFDVHTLDISAVLEREGTRFRDFRQNINRAQKHDLRVENIELPRHRKCIEKIVLEWAESHVNGFSSEDLFGATLATLELKENTDLEINGVLVFEENKPVSFMIWEETRPEEALANGLCNTNISQSKGVSEFTYLAACQVLHERGFQKICVGGSEKSNIGLDYFKRKMNPCYSHKLLSMSFAE